MTDVAAALLPGGEEGSSADDCKDLGNKALSGDDPPADTRASKPARNSHAHRHVE
jgi:hypothetical protein